MIIHMRLTGLILEIMVCLSTVLEIVPKVKNGISTFHMTIRKKKKLLTH
jgi:hypothetical protein